MFVTGCTLKPPWVTFSCDFWFSLTSSTLLCRHRTPDSCRCAQVLQDIFACTFCNIDNSGLALDNLPNKKNGTKIEKVNWSSIETINIPVRVLTVQSYALLHGGGSTGVNFLPQQKNGPRCRRQKVGKDSCGRCTFDAQFVCTAIASVV